MDKEKTSSLSNVRQGPDERYEDFVSRLITAIGRITNNEEVSEVLIKTLAFENANPTCQALLRPIKHSGNVTDYIKQCADVSPAFIRGVAIAAVLKGKTYSQFMEGYGTKEVQTGTQVCHNCRQPGHLYKRCPNKAQNNNGKNSKHNVPGSICPRCKKGFHWAKDCKSKFHKDGHPLENNVGNSGNSRKAPAPRPHTTNRAVNSESIHALRPVSELLRATSGSAGLDLNSSTSAILTPDMPPITVPTGIKGPLPEGVVGLILGRSSPSLQGVSIIPGVIDSDYEGEVKIMINPPTETQQIFKGQRIAQLILLPYYSLG